MVALKQFGYPLDNFFSFLWSLHIFASKDLHENASRRHYTSFCIQLIFMKMQFEDHFLFVTPFLLLLFNNNNTKRLLNLQSASFISKHFYFAWKSFYTNLYETCHNFTFLHWIVKPGLVSSEGERSLCNTFCFKGPWFESL